MNSFFRYIRSYFNQENETIVDQTFDLEEINRGGFPSDVIAFAYDFGAIAVATSNTRLLLFGYQGASWTIDLNYKCEDEIAKLHVHSLYFISANNIFVLCQGPIIISVEFNGKKMLRKQIIMLDNNLAYTWNLTHIQNISETENNLLYCVDHDVYRISPNSTGPDLLISCNDISKWKSVDDLISCITTLPSEKSITIILTDKGTTGIYNDSQLLRTLSMKTFDDEAIQTLVWRPGRSNLAYGISCNNKFSKWNLDWGRSEMFKVEEVKTDPLYDFGPYPCNHVRHFSISVDEKSAHRDYLVFQGGRSSGKYDDRNLISIIHGDCLEKFELSSEVIGIACANDMNEGTDQTNIAMIFTKCEVVGIDLSYPVFNSLRSDQFLSINNSNPTAQSRVVDIEESSWKRIELASKLYWSNNFVSNKEWPLSFPKHHDVEYPKTPTLCQLYISGHSNGDVCIWNTSKLGMPLMLVINTAIEFQAGQQAESEAEKMTMDYKNNIIKKIGKYDPFDDELELQIKNIYLDPKSGTLIISNRGGYIFIYDFFECSDNVSCWEPLAANVSKNQETRHRMLKPRSTAIKYSNGYQLRNKNGCNSPLVFVVSSFDRINTVVYSHKHNFMAVGGTFGLTCVDATHGYILFENSYNADSRSDSTSTANRLKRFSSLKKSLRKTFRRKKNPRVPQTTAELQEFSSEVQFPYSENFLCIEREVGTRDGDCGNCDPDQVTCLRLLKFPIMDEKTVDDVLAVGLNSGIAIFYSFIANESSIKQTFQLEYVKKITLNQQIPVRNIDITNEDGYFLSTTRIVLITDEDIRVYTCLPLMKRNSYKLTANEGVKIKHGIVSRLPRKGSKSLETCIVLFTNDGMLRVHSVADPSHFQKITFIEGTSVVTMDSIFLTRNGEASNLVKFSELEIKYIYGKTHKNV